MLRHWESRLAMRHPVFKYHLAPDLACQRHPRLGAHYQYAQPSITTLSCSVGILSRSRAAICKSCSSSGLSYISMQPSQLLFDFWHPKWKTM
ncbi:hypothetical protein EJ03DRAFT_187545 [Teratosphaeria nubilosa]|uniref:Uncharacterized protein n=1 Tax=Teratosphaeria nubilosa TaxID=161662 RepID=A0A6G1LJ03_9PEZI|nr:hypothetical protein EJ03DRAFT_187545 [Teratosphaeria nubilosa]